MLNHYIENQVIIRQQTQCLFLLISNKSSKVNKKSRFFTVNLDDILEYQTWWYQAKMFIHLLHHITGINYIRYSQQKGFKRLQFFIILWLFFMDSEILKNYCFYTTVK